jgi:hypothetical protein
MFNVTNHLDPWTILRQSCLKISRLLDIQLPDITAAGRRVRSHRSHTTEALMRQCPRASNTWSWTEAHVSKLGHLLVGSCRGRTAPFVFAVPIGVAVSGPRSRGAWRGAVASLRSREQRHARSLALADAGSRWGFAVLLRFSLCGGCGCGLGR